MDIANVKKDWVMTWVIASLPLQKIIGLTSCYVCVKTKENSVCFFFIEALGKNASATSTRPRPTAVVGGMNSSKTALLSRMTFVQSHTSVPHHDLLVKSTIQPSRLYGKLHCACFIGDEVFVTILLLSLFFVISSFYWCVVNCRFYYVHAVQQFM